MQKSFTINTQNAHNEIDLLKKIISANSLLKEGSKNANLIWFATAKQIQETGIDIQGRIINKIPGIRSIACKSEFARILNTVQKYFPYEYNICPETYLFPHDYELLKDNFGTGTYLSKPTGGAHGTGIIILRSV